MSKKSVLVTGAGGFIGHHLVKYLRAKGYYVRGADIKMPEYEESTAHEFMQVDLRNAENCRLATEGMEDVYHLAADMGGIGYIVGQHASIAMNDTFINANMLKFAHENKAKRLLFSSTACIYPQHLQTTPDVTPLKETDAWPAEPEEGYGLEKLYMEKLCQYHTEDYGFQTRVVRFHNVYGPLGTYDGGKEKAPAAISRKISLCRNGGEIEIWGDGKQTRSFMYIDDCVEGIYRIMQSNYHMPLNLGTDEMVTVDELVDIVATAAGKTVVKRHDLTRPQGVRGRNSDNTLLREVLGWEPKIELREGIVPTYAWISERLAERSRDAVGAAAE